MGACTKYKTQKNKCYFEKKCLDIFIKKNPLLGIYKENKSSADYVQVGGKQEKQN
jgi:hypothetical protein